MLTEERLGYLKMYAQHGIHLKEQSIYIDPHAVLQMVEEIASLTASLNLAHRMHASNEREILRRAAELEKRNEELESEITRLSSGRFTPTELQNLCHNLSEADYKAFCDGCDAYQKILFGKCRSEEQAIHNVFRDWVAEERERFSCGGHRSKEAVVSCCTLPTVLAAISRMPCSKGWRMRRSVWWPAKLCLRGSGDAWPWRQNLPR